MDDPWSRKIAQGNRERSRKISQASCTRERRELLRAIVDRNVTALVGESRIAIVNNKRLMFDSFAFEKCNCRQ